MTPLSAEDVIAALQLEPHPLEGGFFRETYHTRQHLPEQERPLSTAIYYLLTPRTCSRLHRLPTDEIYHFYMGDPVHMLNLHADGHGEEIVLGTDLRAAHKPQLVVPGGVWQGSCLVDGGQFALLGTTMTPGFAYPDYEAGDRGQLSARYPAFAGLIARLTLDH